jgi:hypothetical protein
MSVLQTFLVMTMLQQLPLHTGAANRGGENMTNKPAGGKISTEVCVLNASLPATTRDMQVLQALIAADPSIRGQLQGEGRAHQLADKWRAAVANRRQEPSELQSLMQFVREDSQQQQQQQQLPGPDLGSSFSQLQPHPQQQPHIS